MMNTRSIVIFGFGCLLLAGLGLASQFPYVHSVVQLDLDQSVQDAIESLGGPEATNRPKEVKGASVERGYDLVHKGVADKPVGSGNTKRQSKHFVCTSCHNTTIEQSDLTQFIPQDRLDYAIEHNLPFLQGTTLYGAVNRQTYYNGDYDKKYGDLVKDARNDIRGAINLCAVECAQGRPLKEWELESILMYLWQLELKLQDLNLTPDEQELLAVKVANKKPDQTAVELLRSKFATASPATFALPPGDRKVGYQLTGDPTNGAAIYKHGCLHCHNEQRYSMLDLDDSKLSKAFLARHMPRYSPYSTYQVGRYGTPPRPGKGAYMPQYTAERMSDQQFEDLRAYFEQK